MPFQNCKLHFNIFWLENNRKNIIPSILVIFRYGKVNIFEGPAHSSANFLPSAFLVGIPPAIAPEGILNKSVIVIWLDYVDLKQTKTIKTPRTCSIKNTIPWWKAIFLECDKTKTEVRWSFNLTGLGIKGTWISASCFVWYPAKGLWMQYALPSIYSRRDLFLDSHFLSYDAISHPFYSANYC